MTITHEINELDNYWWLAYCPNCDSEPASHTITDGPIALFCNNCQTPKTVVDFGDHVPAVWPEEVSEPTPAPGHYVKAIAHVFNNYLIRGDYESADAWWLGYELDRLYGYTPKQDQAWSAVFYNDVEQLNDDLAVALATDSLIHVSAVGLIAASLSRDACLNFGRGKLTALYGMPFVVRDSWSGRWRTPSFRSLPFGSPGVECAFLWSDLYLNVSGTRGTITPYSGECTDLISYDQGDARTWYLTTTAREWASEKEI